MMQMIMKMVHESMQAVVAAGATVAANAVAEWLTTVGIPQEAARVNSTKSAEPRSD